MSDSEHESGDVLYYSCPWCEYEFRKRRYFQPHVWEEHLEQVWKGEGRLPDQ